jgi:membrane-bound lytic murein transglycosylase B
MAALVIRLATLLVLLLGSPALAQPIESFEAFVAGFRSKALAAGVSAAVYDGVMTGMTPDPKVPDLVATQPEFTTPMWDYIESRVTSARVERGRAALAANADLFGRIGQTYGVDPSLLGAIWGMETDYGAVLGNGAVIRPIVRSLATIVHQRRTRLAEDEADLVAALLLVQRGPLDAQQLVGSWAGAIGHLQVNPSNVVAHGTDGDGDGRVDLHHSLPDALATSARFIRGLGYQPGLDWGMEVSVPDGFDYLLATRTQMRPVSFFAERGVGRVSRREFSDANLPVFLYVPAGQNGPKFLMTQNYLVLKGYNFSDSYALSVAHMADRLKGAGGFAQDWPRQTRFPNLAERKSIQSALIRLGLYAGAVDGRVGPITQEAYARFQAAQGQVADGFITREAYTALSAAVQ